MLRIVSTASAVAAMLVFGITSVGAMGAAPSNRTTLHGSAPGWAKQGNLVGAADPGGTVGFRVYLGWNDAAGAEALANAVSVPSSSSYGHYLTPSEFRRRFAPTQAQVGAVQSWLRSQGFKVDYTPANNHYVAAEGTVAQAEAAFGTQFAMYSVRGKSVRSPSADIAIPNALAGSVTGVVGLDDSAVFVETDHVVDKNAPPSPGFRNAPPLSAYWAQFVSPYAYPPGFTAVASPSTAPWTVKGYTPTQVKGA
jgi:subtilase family serine protease